MSRAGSLKLLATTGIKLRLAAISGLVLVAGALLAPGAAPVPVPPLEERSAPLIQDQIRPLAAPAPFAGVDEIADRLRQHTVSIRATRPTIPATVTDFSEERSVAMESGYGVVVSSRYVLTHAAALGGRSAVDLVTADGLTIVGTVVAYDPATALALLEAPVAAAQSATRAQGSTRPGALVVAVGTSEGRDAASPSFVTRVADNRFYTGAASSTGSPVYDLAGALLGISAGPGSGGLVVAVADLADTLMGRATSGQTAVSFGLALQDIDESLARVFGNRGTVISDVLPAAPAAQAGIVPGDVLVAIAGAEVASARDAAGALAGAPADRPTALTILRLGRERIIDVTPGSAYAVAALARDAASASSGPEARAILPQDVLMASAIQPTARVISVNGATASTRRPVRLARGRPVLVGLEQDGVRYFAVVTTPR